MAKEKYQIQARLEGKLVYEKVICKIPEAEKSWSTRNLQNLYTVADI